MSATALDGRSSSTRSWPDRHWATLTVAVLVYVGLLAAVEVVAVVVGPLQAAACLAGVVIALVNLTVLARLRETHLIEGLWRLLAIAAIPPVEQLLILCMPPLRWGGLQEYVLWTVPLVAGLLVLVRTPLLAEVAQLRPRLVRTRRGGYGLQGLAGQVLVAALGGVLGVIAALIPEQGDRSIAELLRAAQPAWLGILAAVFAGCSQEFLYRTVVQPVATGVATWIGLVVSSTMMSTGWLLWVGGVFAFPVVATSLLFGWVVHHTQALIGALVGHGLFILALTLLWQRMLL